MSADPLQRLLASRVAAGRTPAASWWVGHPGAPLAAGAVGKESLEPAGAPATGQTAFDLASLTKPLVTAMLLVLLERERRLDLEAPLCTVLTELEHFPLGGRSLLALATHTAGLPAWAPLYLQASDLEGYVAEILRGASGSDADATLYSDLGYVLLGAVIERVTGRALDTLFDERIARPLALRRTGYARAGEEFPGCAATERGNGFERAMAGEDGAGHRWRTEIPPGQVHDANAYGLGGVAGHAGLFGTAEEVARLAAEMIRPERLGLDTRARDRLLRADPRSAGRSVGLVVAAQAAAARGILPDDAPGHTGFTGTSLWLDPARERIYVLLTNRVHPRVPDRPFGSIRRAFHRLAQRRFE